MISHPHLRLMAALVLDLGQLKLINLTLSVF